MTAGLIISKLDDIFSCMHADGTPFAGIATFGNTYSVEVVSLNQIKSHAKKHGFKVVALGGFVSAHTITSKLGSEGRPNAEDEKMMIDFGRKVYEKVLSGDYVLHGKTGKNIPAEDAAKAAEYDLDKNIFPPEFKEKSISDACIKCKTCVRHCPADAIDIDNKKFDLNKCIGCFACINRCPKHAIILTSKEMNDVIKKFSGAITTHFENDIVF